MFSVFISDILWLNFTSNFFYTDYCNVAMSSYNRMLIYMNRTLSGHLQELYKGKVQLGKLNSGRLLTFHKGSRNFKSWSLTRVVPRRASTLPLRGTQTLTVIPVL